MTPREGTRARLRSHEACLNCRRKKTRCPAEKPICSTCARLNQPCFYTPMARGSRGSQSEDRLAYLEEKVNLILNGTRPSSSAPQEQVSQTHDQIDELLESCSTATHPSTEPSGPVNDPLALGLGFEDMSSPRPSQSAIVTAIDLYFLYCHRQPIWCFNRDELDDHCQELVYSILALTSRFLRERAQLQRYGDAARRLVMLRIANGTVELETIESLCLLSYSSFMDGNIHLGRFHLGLAFQLCRLAMLYIDTSYNSPNPTAERKKRLFWTLQSLEQTYGQHDRPASFSAEGLRTFYLSADQDSGLHRDRVSRPPPLPRDSVGCSADTDIGIWNLAIHFGWVWSGVRRYVSDCARNRLIEPWRHDSMYTMVISDLTEIENKLPMCHRYDQVKFYEREPDELRIIPDYWASWLKLQFTYHSILTVLNHPFLYIVASQFHSNLTIPNSFWRRSSELVLLHATWVVRLIDMVTDKRVRLTDPFFGHAAAITATVHLYYCAAADPRLKNKSKIDFTKCRRFLKGFICFSPACETLDRILDRMTRIASGSENINDDWEPTKIHLSIPLMWDVLQVNTALEPRDLSAAGLLHSSLTPEESRADREDSTASTIEVIVAMSPEVTVNTTDGGLATHMPPRQQMAVAPADLGSPGTSAVPDKLVAPADSLMLNTPWLWADPAQMDDMDNMNYNEPESTIPAIEGFSTWWDFGNL